MVARLPSGVRKMEDPLRTRLHPSSISERFKDHSMRNVILRMLREITAETQHIQTAARKLEHAVRTNASPFNNGLAKTKQELRDWTLSLIETIAHLETSVGGKNALSQFELLARRAIDRGQKNALSDFVFHVSGPIDREMFDHH